MSASQTLPMASSDPATQAPDRERTNPIREAIAEAIAENDVILFMKGTPEAPACGFSARTVAVLQALDARSRRSTCCPTPASARSSPRSRNWPTIPQLFVNGELVGGCDIVTEMYETGELAELLRHDPVANARKPFRRREESPADPADGAEDRVAVGCSPDAPRRDRHRLHPLPSPRARRQRRASTRSASTWAGAANAGARPSSTATTPSTSGCARDPRAADHLAALDRRLPRGLGAAAGGRAGHRLGPPRGRHLRHLRGGPPGARRCSPSAASASASR